MKDVLAFLLTVGLTVGASYYTSWKPVVPMIMFTYFPIERITKTRKRPIKNCLVKIINRRYVWWQVLLTLVAFPFVYGTPEFLPTIQERSLFNVVFLTSLYETIVFQGFMMGYWNHNPKIGVLATSMLQASQYMWGYNDEVVIVMFLHSLIDCLALEKYPIYKIGAKKIFVRFILFMVAKFS
jgi:hypothetical protein